MNKIAFVFPGQGSQYVGMGRELKEKFQSVANIFAEADNRLGYSLSDLCFNGPEEKLKLTVHTQPALLTTSIACYQLIKEKGIKPEYVAGHSLGEYSALVVSEALSFSDAVWLVEQRGKYMQEAVAPGKGTMAAILGLGIEEINKLCLSVKDVGVVEPANFNCPGQIVIAGETPAVQKAVDVAKEFGAKRAVLLPVSGPFHSSLLKSAGINLAKALDSVTIKNPQIPVIANVSANEVYLAEVVRENLIMQVSTSVKWEQSVRYMLAKGVSTFVEIGAGRVLSGLIKKIDRSVKILNVEDINSLEKTLNEL